MDNQKSAKELLDEVIRVKGETVELLKEVKQRSVENTKLLRRTEELMRHGLENVSPKVRAEIAEEVRNRNCRDVILGITELAIDNHEIIHIHPDYSPHVNGFDVYVYPCSESYEDNQTKPILIGDVPLTRNRFEDNATPLQQLLELEDKLLALIAEAKDKAGVEA